MQIDKAIIAAIASHAATAHPRECCGLLLGPASEHITAIQPARNVAADPARHFEIDPQTLFEAIRAERDGGMEIVGYYHSHPNGLAEPSATDAAQAARDGKVWAIIARGKIGLWHDTPAGFVPLSYRIADD
ncbi:Mov34/MPN/PAD-1 family protein [Alteripontixanthobacter maritimus]|uniref:Mov34/MPN/PAD-1 family protein n=1 Tax=Alteripontixanthobacter maritimus TaxID=2161824 RepID=UPI0015F043E4|nr:M67 family metallopeptidase [Alteripontixanthobacter maritimus]